MLVEPVAVLALALTTDEYVGFAVVIDVGDRDAGVVFWVACRYWYAGGEFGFFCASYIWVNEDAFARSDDEVCEFVAIEVCHVDGGMEAVVYVVAARFDALGYCREFRSLLVAFIGAYTNGAIANADEKVEVAVLIPVNEFRVEADTGSEASDLFLLSPLVTLSVPELAEVDFVTFAVCEPSFFCVAATGLRW